MAEGLVGDEGFAVDTSLIKADTNCQNGVPGKNGLAPETANQAEREYLTMLDDAAFGAATPVVPKFISPADPAARWAAAHSGLAFFAYTTNDLIDLKHAVIMDVEATTAVRQAEVGAARTMIGRTQDRFSIWPEKLVANATYARPRTWRGWYTSAVSSRISWCSTNPGAVTAPSAAPASPMITIAISTSAQAARSCGSSAGPSRCRATVSILKASCATGRSSATAIPEAAVLSERSCSQDPPLPSTKAPATWRATSPPPMPTSPRDASGRRSRCCLRTLSESSNSIACACEDHAVPATSSSSQRPPRTS